MLHALGTSVDEALNFGMSSDEAYERAMTKLHPLVQSTTKEEVLPMTTNEHEVASNASTQQKMKCLILWFSRREENEATSSPVAKVSG